MITLRVLMHLPLTACMYIKYSLDRGYIEVTTAYVIARQGISLTIYIGGNVNNIHVFFDK